jgi:hypothetical protein
MESHDPRPDQEHFGEASLGDAQSSDPPADPEMLREDGPASGAGGERSAAEGAAEGPGAGEGDQDAEAPLSSDDVERDDGRDQAEG